MSIFFYFLLASLESTHSIDQVVLNCFDCTHIFPVITLFSILKYNGKLEGYGDKFPVPIKQSVLEEKTLQDKHLCASLKEQSPVKFILLKK